MTTTKTCKACGATKPIDDFYKHPRMADGRLSFCKPCVCARVRRHRRDNPHVAAADSARYHLDEERRASIDERARHGRVVDPPKYRARTALNNAVRDGKIKKPEACPRCGRGGRIEGHHHDYTKPLDVEWLCSRCHRREDFAREP